MSIAKQPLDENGEGNCCPECGSLKISVNYQFPLFVEMDLNSRNEIFKDADGKRIKQTNRLLARRYKNSQLDAQCWNYECRKCGWISEMFVP